MNQSDNRTMLAAQAESGFLALTHSNFDTMMSEEFAGLEMKPDRIKMPGAGGTMYGVPEDWSDDPVKEFSAVILYQHPTRSFYQGEYSGGNNPPDCGSIDGITGVGSPGGQCNKCKNNVYGTGKNGSKACKDKRRLFIMRDGDVFPTILILPTGSLAPFTRYLKEIVPRFGKPYGAVTRFSLKLEKNKGGIPYAQARFNIERPLSDDELTVVAKLSEQIKAYSQRLGFDSDNDNGTDGIDNTNTLPFDEYIDAETGEVMKPLIGG